MVKNTDDYLLKESMNIKFIVKVKTFLFAKTIDTKDYTNLTKRDLNPHFYILHVGTNHQMIFRLMKRKK